MFKSKRAFSLTELLTTVGIAGVLSVVGIKSYQKQTNQAKTAEAKKSLSYIYSAQRSFYNNWGSYHENLMAVGAIPIGIYNYDAGFGKAATLSYIDGYPEVNNKKVLNQRECTNFYQICAGECLDALKSKAPDYDGPYKPACEVNSAIKLKGYTGTHSSSAKAGSSVFTAIATTKLKKVDIWSIDQQGRLANETDGT